VVVWIVTYAFIVVTIKLFPQFAPQPGIAMGTGFLVIFCWSLGAWAGYKIVEFGGNFIHVMVVAVAMAVVAVILQIVVVGAVVGDLAGQVPVAVFTAVNTIAGALTGGGFGLIK
jgi:hypothetical protein